MMTTNKQTTWRDRRAFALASLLVVSLICALATTTYADALAKPTDPVARERLTTGNRYYRLREFEKAIEEYKAGVLKEDAPVFYFNLGQCYRKLGRAEDAIWHYERFLDRGKPTGEVEASVKKFIGQLKDELEATAMRRPRFELAPSVEPTRTAAVGPARPGNTLPVSPPHSEQRHGMPLQRKLAIGAGVAGVAAVGLGVVLGLRAESFEDDADAICPTSTCARADEVTELIDRGKTNALYAKVALGIGGAALLGAAVLWVTGAPRERKGATIAPQASHSFTGVVASIPF